jgi:hypothetical protein
MVTTLGQLARDRRQPVEVFDAAMVRTADRGFEVNGGSSTTARAPQPEQGSSQRRDRGEVAMRPVDMIGPDAAGLEGTVVRVAIIRVEHRP